MRQRLGAFHTGFVSSRIHGRFLGLCVDVLASASHAAVASANDDHEAHDDVPPPMPRKEPFRHLQEPEIDPDSHPSALIPYWGDPDETQF